MRKYRIRNSYDGPWLSGENDSFPAEVDADDAVVYLASEVDAHIAEMEQAATRRVVELEKALRFYALECDAHVWTAIDSGDTARKALGL